MPKKNSKMSIVIGLVAIVVVAGFIIANRNVDQDISNEVSENESAQNIDIDQIASDFLAEGIEEKTESDSENDEADQITIDNEAINNLTQTYDEKEF